MAKIRKFIVPLTLVGVVAFLPRVFRTKSDTKKKDSSKNIIDKRYDIDDDNLFI